MALVKENMHITLKQAWTLLREAITQIAPELCSVQHCYERLLAADLLSQRNVPHYNASAMDGFALSSASTAHATPSSPVFLRRDEFARLNTGGVLPTSFDAVAMIEDVALSSDGEKLTVAKTLVAGENVRPVGEDVFRGQVIARVGERISPPLASLCATAGIPSVSVQALPKTLFIPTGDEIIPLEEWLSMDEPPAGKVGESNSFLVQGYFSRWGFPVDIAPCLPDNPEVLSEFLLKKAEEYDLLLVGAGSAKGEKDYTFSIFDKYGKPIFRWLLMKPGRPASAALLRRAVAVNLPGFPMSNAVILWSIVYPILQLLQKGGFDESSAIQEALGAEGSEEMSLLVSCSSSPGKEEWLRLKCVEIDGRKMAYPLPSGASALWSLAEIDAVSLLPLESAELPKGSAVSVWTTRRIPWKERILFQGSNDPALERLPSFVRKQGGDLLLRSVGSLAGLAALSRRECHIAAAHLLHAETVEYNSPFIDELFHDPETVVRRRVFFREQGFITKKGNPKKISGVRDLDREDILLVNRQRGAGTRVLLDALLDEAGIHHSAVRGYNSLSPTHFESANRVALGFVDVALGIKSVADALDLDFIPVAEEPYELVYLKEFESLTGLKAVLNALDDKEWRAGVLRMGGYRWAE